MIPYKISVFKGRRHVDTFIFPCIDVDWIDSFLRAGFNLRIKKSISDYV